MMLFKVIDEAIDIDNLSKNDAAFLLGEDLINFMINSHKIDNHNLGKTKNIFKILNTNNWY